MHRVIDTYHDLQSTLASFADGLFDMLVIHSPPGTGKTTLVKHHYQGQRVLWLEGKCTPLRLFEMLYEYQDATIILDDFTSYDKTVLGMIRTLCDSSEKTLQWHTRSPLRGDTPAQYATSSPILILTNTWQSDTPEQLAIEDRGVAANFKPSPLTMLEYAQSWISEDMHRFFHRYLTAPTPFQFTGTPPCPEI